jgi:enoyl-CoA hydratase/carnithine racemase
VGDPAAARGAASRGDAVVTLSEQLERNKLTIEELEAIVRVLELVEDGEPEVRAVLVKLRWHIAASRNEVEYDTGPTQV